MELKTFCATLWGRTLESWTQFPADPSICLFPLMILPYIQIFCWPHFCLQRINGSSSRMWFSSPFIPKQTLWVYLGWPETTWNIKNTLNPYTDNLCIHGLCLISLMGTTSPTSLLDRGLQDFSGERFILTFLLSSFSFLNLLMQSWVLNSSQNWDISGGWKDIHSTSADNALNMLGGFVLVPYDQLCKFILPRLWDQTWSFCLK